MQILLFYDLCCRQYSARGSSARREPTFSFTVISKKPFLAFQVSSVDSSLQISSSCASLVLSEILCQILLANATQKHKIVHVNHIMLFISLIDRSIECRKYITYLNPQTQCYDSPRSLKSSFRAVINEMTVNFLSTLREQGSYHYFRIETRN